MNSSQGLEMPTLVVTADVGKLVLEMGEDLVEGHNGFLLGGVRRSKVNCLGGGLEGVWIISLWITQSLAVALP